MSCSGSSTGAAKADFARITGVGGSTGLGTAMARGGVALVRGSGVSGGFGEVFLFGVGDFSGVVFFFFFPFADASFSGDFFGFGVASGVSLVLGNASDSFAGDFFALAFFLGDGEADAFFFFLLGDVFDFGVGVGVLSAESTGRAGLNIV